MTALTDKLLKMASESNEHGLGLLSGDATSIEDSNLLSIMADLCREVREACRPPTGDEYAILGKWDAKTLVVSKAPEGKFMIAASGISEAHCVIRAGEVLELRAYQGQVVCTKRRDTLL
jgi:hypothetical protein